MAKDGITYTGFIVGRSPFFRGKSTINIKTVIVPVQLNFVRSSTSTFTYDPTAADDGCLGAGNTGLSLTQQSPLFNSAPTNYVFGGVNIGNTQSTDVYERANFWTLVGGTPYHTLLSVTTAPLQIVNVPSDPVNDNGHVFGLGGVQCGTNVSGSVNRHATIGVMDINFWDPIAQGLITSLGIGNDTFPFFLFYDAVMSDGDPTNLRNCCIGGYHNNIPPGANQFVVGQTYGNGEFEPHNQTVFGGTADVSILTHEIAEWMDDPDGVNPTPLWGNIGQVGGCQNNLEVGDPLTGTLMPTVTMSNGFTYHLQELVFFSWFFNANGSPSLGVNGWFSENGSFLGPAITCPPGGTN